MTPTATTATVYLAAPDLDEFYITEDDWRPSGPFPVQVHVHPGTACADVAKTLRMLADSLEAGSQPDVEPHLPAWVLDRAWRSGP